MSLRCIAFSLFAWLALCAAAEARPRQAPSAPHVLPAAGASAARSEPATWLVGTRLTPATRAIARAHAARLLSPRGVFVVERDRARPFALALQAAGTYRFAEPDVRLRAAKREDGTEWRPALLGSLQPPPVEQAPLTAVIDASVDAGHPELAGIRVAGDPAVTDAHGTAVASMITGRGNGVFPGAPVLAIGKSLRTSDLTAGIAEAVKADARIINMSFGGPDPNYAMYVEIAYAVSQGVLCVAAAGNDYYTVLEDGTVNPVMYPAAYPHVLSVSSLGPAGASSDFSTANGAVDLAAPGEGVLAAVPVALDDDGVPDGYQRLDGTSFSAPIVAGTAAWLMTARPDLGARQAADVLRFSATDVDDPGWDSDTGYGQVNLAAALSEPAPQVDKLEVDDDVEWVDGSRFNKPDPYFYRGFTARRATVASVDAWKDPADVYRVQLPGRSRLKITLRTSRDADPDLAVFSTRASSIYEERGFVTGSRRAAGRTDGVVIRNSARSKRTAYVVVYAPDTDADRLDAPYSLTVQRQKR